MKGSKREKRRMRHWRNRASRDCGCWFCLPSKKKLNSVARSTRERKALRAEEY